MRAAQGCVAAACAATLTPVSAASPVPAAARPLPAAAVTTVGGPGFCSIRGDRDPTSASVRALAVDAAGDVFFDTGPPAAGAIARVVPDGSVSLLVTGVPAERPLPSSAGGTSVLPVAGRLAADGAGGVIVAAGARVLDVDATNSVTTIAGDPGSSGDGDGSGSTGDGGPASMARIARAASVATDDAGNVYFADVTGGGTGHSAIRFINRSSSTVTFFGGTPAAVAVPPGRIQTIGGSSLVGKEPAATPSDFYTAYLPAWSPVLAVAGERLYLAVAGLSARSTRVLAVNLGRAPITAQGVTIGPGQIAAVAGSGATTSAAEAFPLGTVSGLTASADGRLYLAEEAHHRVLQADASGSLTVFAGRAGGRQSDAGFDGDGQPAVGTRLNQPFDVKIGGDRVYISDQANDEVRAVDTDGIIRAVRGGGIATRWACSGTGGGSELFGSPGAPTGVVSDQSGVIYAALPALNRVQRIDLAGVATTVAGGGADDPGCRRPNACAGFAGDAGPAVDAKLDRPTAVALGSAGQLYILDAGNARVRLVNLADQTIQAQGVTVDPGDIATVAGNGAAGFSGDGGIATRARILGAPAYARDADSIAAQMDDPRAYALGSLATGPGGDLFIAGGPEKRVRRVDSRGVISSITAVAAPGANRCCRDAVAVAADAAGILFIADRGGTDSGGTPQPRLWAMNRTHHDAIVLGVAVSRGTTVAVVGDGAFGSDGDGGPALQASLEVLVAVAPSRSGSVFIAEAGRSTGAAIRLSDVRGVDASGTITTVAGGGPAGFNGDGLPAVAAALDLPSGVAADRCGNLLIADAGNDRVRRALLGGACPPIGDAAPAETGPPAALLPAGLLLLITVVAAPTTLALRRRLRRRAAPLRRASETKLRRP